MPPLVWVFAAFIGFALLRVPVAYAIGIAALVGLLFSPLRVPLSTIPTVMWSGVNSFILLAIPLFLMMGNLAMVTGVTQRLVAFATAFFGHVNGGLAHVCIVANMIMAGMSGSDLADAAATGSVLIPAMERNGYPKAYAAAVVSAAATMGPLIPPSIGMLVFSAATDTSVGRLFLGGALPGTVLGLLLMLHAYMHARSRKYIRSPRLSNRERLRTTVISLPVLALPVVVLGSILTGIATPTESAMLGVMGVIAVGLIYRELTLAAFREQAIQTLRTTASIYFIVAAAAALGRVLTLYGAADAAAAWVTSVTSDPLVFLLAVNLVYLFLGCFIDSIPVILVFVPLLMPTVKALGIDPVHFGVITVFNTLLGLVTPPYGLTMFLMCRLAKIDFIELWRHLWVMFLVMLVALLLTTVYPPLTLALPNLLLPVR